jgi:hypothetical protein
VILRSILGEYVYTSLPYKNSFELLPSSLAERYGVFAKDGSQGLWKTPFSSSSNGGSAKKGESEVSDSPFKYLKQVKYV